MYSSVIFVMIPLHVRRGAVVALAESMILQGFSNLNDSMILSLNEQLALKKTTQIGTISFPYSSSTSSPLSTHIKAMKILW